MQRVQPCELTSLTGTETEDANPEQALEYEERNKVTSFSWDVSIKFFDKKTVGRLGKADIFFMDDGFQINDEDYLTCVTEEICREYGFELLDALADLILPIGFGYPSLINDLAGVVEDAFKPVSKVGNRKTIVWIEDEHWNTPNSSIVEPLVMQLLLEKTEPFLIAPMKYYDKEVLSTVFKVGDMKVDGNKSEEESSSNCWEPFTSLLKFGFLLTLRSNSYPLILLHFSQKLAENVDAFKMLDLAEAEGHEIKYFKNTPPISDRDVMISDFVKKLISKQP